MEKDRQGIRHFFAAFGYSLSGLRAAFAEAAFRQELLLGVIHILSIAALDISRMSALLLSVLYMGVLTVELINSAIESVVDLVSPEHNLLAGRAKDMASAAVFLSLLTYVAAWVGVLAV